MKKLIFTLILTAIFLKLSAGFSAVAASGFARSRIFYENHEYLIITHPNENSRVTASSRMSFLGDSDPRNSLTINGEEIDRTQNGFFTYYASLELGENVFVIRNGDIAETVIITREEPEDWFPPETFYFTQDIFGTVNAEYIPRFAYFDDDLHGKTPLMSGTTFRILGERGDFYIIGDGTSVFKNHVSQLDRNIGTYTLSGGEVKETGNIISLSFDVSDNPLYEIIFNGNEAVLILYCDRDLSDLHNLLTHAPFVTNVSKNVQREPNAAIYEIEFERVPTGYMVEFSGGKMNIDFRFAPLLLTDAYVLLDAGHGGGDPGALGPPGEFGSMEKDFNLYVAEIARDYLRRLGINVYLIRDTDEFVQIMDRVEYFKTAPDIAVSVHVNSAPLTSDFGSLSGPLMFYTLDTSENAADDMITFINSAVVGDGGTIAAQPPLHRRQNFAMSRYTGGPSMLFEMGFMCNPAEYELMLNTDYLDRLGLSLAMSIEQYLKNIMLAENPDAAETFPEPLPAPPRTVSEIADSAEDAHPVMVRVYEQDGIHGALIRYIILIASVMVCGAALVLPNILKRK